MCENVKPDEKLTSGFDVEDSVLSEQNSSNVEHASKENQKVPNKSNVTTPSDEIYEESAKQNGDLIRQVCELNSKLQEAETQLKDWKDRCYREAASKENVRRALTKDVTEAANYANNKVFMDLAAILEDMLKLNSAISELPKLAECCSEYEQKSGLNFDELIASIKSVSEASSMNAKNMEKLFLNHNVSKIPAMGKKFDPRYHQSIKEVHSKDAKDGEIVEVIQDGYLLKERVLKPSIVIIASNK